MDIYGNSSSQAATRDKVSSCKLWAVIACVCVFVMVCCFVAQSVMNHYMHVESTNKALIAVTYADVAARLGVLLSVVLVLIKVLALSETSKKSK